MTEGALSDAQKRWAVWGVTFAAILVVEGIKYAMFVPGVRNYLLLHLAIYQTLLGLTPFLLRRAWPMVAGFEVCWLPAARTQWLWFVGMMLLAVAAAHLGPFLHGFFGPDADLPARIDHSIRAPFDAPVAIVLYGLILVVIAPVVEEVFWRGFVLPQFMKVSPWPLALALQGLLFAIAHLPCTSDGVGAAFLIGLIFGVWRIRFKSLLPIIIAHMIVNGIAMLPPLTAQFQAAERTYPKLLAIERLAQQPPEEALPNLLKYFGDSDEVVFEHAMNVLLSNFRSRAEPYLKTALASKDRRTLDRALDTVGLGGYRGLQSEVRAIAWSFPDSSVQISATLTLKLLHDDNALWEIAREHPDEVVRRSADNLIRRQP